MRDLKHSLVTFVILALATLVYSVSAESTLWAISRNALLQGQVWRIWSHHFFHLSLTHFLWDAAGFTIVGLLLEPRLPRKTFLPLVASIATVCGLAFAAFDPNGEAIGLSGLQQGLVGALVITLFSDGYRFPATFLFFGIVLKLGFEIAGVSTFSQMTSSVHAVAAICHVAGFLTAMVWGALLLKKRVHKRRSKILATE